MKTFLEFMTEQSFSDLVASDPGFSKSMKSFSKNNKITRKIQAREPAELPKFKPSERLEPVDFTGSRYDLGNGQTLDPSSISNKPIAKLDKAYTSGNFNTALAAAGYDQSGKKITAIPKKTGVERADTPISYKPKKVEATYVAHPDYSTKIQDRVFGTYSGDQDNDMKKASTPKEYSSSSYPNVRSAKAGMATDTKFKLSNMMQKQSPTEKQIEPVEKPKVGSLVAPQSGYPAAKKETLAPAENQKASSKVDVKVPIPKARPANLAPKKQTFDQAFAAARKAKLKKFEFEGKEYNTRLK